MLRFAMVGSRREGAPLVVPPGPDVLVLDVARRWDGAPLRPGLRGRVALAAAPDALHVTASLVSPHPVRVPDAPPGARVEGLWRHDVVECFLVGADGRYLELELGAGGHWLALAFDAPRRRAEGGGPAPGERLAVAFERQGPAWTSRCALPRRWVPEPLVRVGAFAHAGGELLAHRAVPGDAPDFHQPAAFPAVRVAAWER